MIISMKTDLRKHCLLFYMMTSHIVTNQSYFFQSVEYRMAGIFTELSCQPETQQLNKHCVHDTLMPPATHCILNTLRSHNSQQKQSQEKFKALLKTTYLKSDEIPNIVGRSGGRKLTGCTMYGRLTQTEMYKSKSMCLSRCGGLITVKPLSFKPF